MTLPEGLLWRVLRTRPEGFKFRRQHPLGSYVGDFYCPAGRLVIEVDGMGHSMGNRPYRDQARDTWLRVHGLKVLRIDASEVMKDLDAVVRQITSACRS